MVNHNPQNGSERYWPANIHPFHKLLTSAAQVQHQVAELTRWKEVAGKLLNSRHGDLRNGDIKLTGK